MFLRLSDEERSFFVNMNKVVQILRYSDDPRDFTNLITNAPNKSGGYVTILVKETLLQIADLMDIERQRLAHMKKASI
ncbi:hypothetical protein ATY81_18365 [Rhizobium sp. R72]|uniref:hypothetical protein n=1 Tax=unclassified Rhizobium TaxID=2613769 RepID=UPI000B533ADE|nr:MULTISPECIES: hypothetical protein [unclassified Rhizobium]OWV98437.1 hypothetical protein ATY79_20095 [Rhizobium sp. R693]OWW03674.1 hypothetical protein ATY81_18365 [Rhizobium sp. R72]OWW03881.1 hypothetical protein ATY80_18365 [Rhizobium sp. R711]